MCAHNEQLQLMVLDNATTGFHFVNEGTAEKPRKGYMANTTGSVLTLQVIHAVFCVRVKGCIVACFISCFWT